MFLTGESYDPGFPVDSIPLPGEFAPEICPLRAFGFSWQGEILDGERESEKVPGGNGRPGVLLRPCFNQGAPGLRLGIRILEQRKMIRHEIGDSACFKNPADGP